MKERIKKIILFFANPRLLLCFAIAWIITNGWSYIMLGLGTFLGSSWMIAVSGAYLAFLWLPISPEKIVTLAIAMALLRFLFPHDEKTLGILKNLYKKIRRKGTQTTERHRQRARSFIRKVRKKYRIQKNKPSV